MKNIICSLFLFPTISLAQNNDNWELFVASKKIMSGEIGVNKYLKIDDATSVKIKFNKQVIKKDWNTSFIIMDSNRVEISRKKLTSWCKNFSITNYLFNKKSNSKQSIKIFILQIPKDPELAARVRMAPLPIVEIAIK